MTDPRNVALLQVLEDSLAVTRVLLRTGRDHEGVLADLHRRQAEAIEAETAKAKEREHAK